MKIKVNKEINLDELKVALVNARNENGTITMSKADADKVLTLIDYLSERDINKIVPKIDSKIAAGASWLKERKDSIVKEMEAYEQKKEAEREAMKVAKDAEEAGTCEKEND